jgi:drug/metabolite transporter (DMT)-like permease
VKVAGLVVSFAGVAVLVARTGLSGGQEALVGDALVLANSLSYSIYLVLSRPVLERYDPLTLIAWVFVFGTFEMAIVALPTLVAVDWAALTPGAWTAFAYALLGATVLTYGINNWALRHTSASHVASFVYLQPLVGALLAAWLLDERLTWHVAVAGALILAGVALASRAGLGRRAANPSE